MSKKFLLQEIRSLEKSIKNVFPKIPQFRINYIRNDCEVLFKDLDNKSESELENIKKIANIKFKSFTRLYDFPDEKENKNNGKNNSNSANESQNEILIEQQSTVKTTDGKELEITKSLEKEYIKKANQTKSFLSKEENEELERITKKLNPQEEEERLEDKKYISKYEEIKNSDGFNKQKVKDFHIKFEQTLLDFDDRNFRLEIQHFKEEVEAMRKEGKDKEITEKFKSFDLMLPRWVSYKHDGTKVFFKERFIKEYSEIYNICFLKGGEEYVKKFLQLNEKKMTQVPSKGGRFIEGSFTSDFMKPTAEDEENFVEGKDGVIDLGMFGDFRITLFDENENKRTVVNKEKIGATHEFEGKALDIDDKVKIERFDNGNSKVGNDGVNVNNENSHREKLVWRNGKLVEGEGEKRKVVSVINWNASNLDPKDVQKHRELIDRQHFSGPLWEGITRKTLMDEPVFIDYENAVTMSKEEDEEFVKKSNAKHKVVEIVR